jgi:hypothetical protein
MKKFILLLWLFSGISDTHAQKQKKLSVNLDIHINNTLYDRTLPNNATGFGFGMQTLIITNSPWKGIVDLAADAYGGTKQLFLTVDGKPVYSKSDVVTAFAGVVFEPNSKWYGGITAGTAIFNSHVYFGLKPLIGIPFLRQRMIFKIGMVHIFQRDEISNQSFGYLTFGLGVKLF